MDMLAYMLFSILETSAMFYLMFKAFKIEIFPIPIVFASTIMSLISYMIRTEYQVPEVDVFLQILMFYCFTWLLFRIHYIYAVIMTGMIYQSYVLIQTIYYIVMEKIGFFNASMPYIFNISTFILQTVSALTAYGIGWYVYKKRKGFDFVPDKPNGKIPLKIRDKVLLALTFPSIFIITATMYLTEHFHLGYLAVPCVSVAILFGYIYFSYKKDRVDNEDFSL